MHYNGETVTDPDRIIQIMQEWYEHTANAAQPQLETLENFLADQQIELPKIGQDLHAHRRNIIIGNRGSHQ